MTWLERIFSSSSVEQRPDYALAHEILDWASQSYHARFMAWIEEQILKPTDPQMDRMEAAMKAEAFKEIRARIKQIIAASEAALAMEKEDMGRG